MSIISHCVVTPAGHITDHHVRHRHDLAILGLLNEDSNTARNELTVKLNALCTSNELPITVVTCNETDKGLISYQYFKDIIQNNPTSTIFQSLISMSVLTV